MNNFMKQRCQTNDLNIFGDSYFGDSYFNFNSNDDYQRIQYQLSDNFAKKATLNNTNSRTQIKANEFDIISTTTNDDISSYQGQFDSDKKWKFKASKQQMNCCQSENNYSSSLTNYQDLTSYPITTIKKTKLFLFPSMQKYLNLQYIKKDNMQFFHTNNNTKPKTEEENNNNNAQEEEDEQQSQQ